MLYPLGATQRTSSPRTGSQPRNTRRSTSTRVDDALCVVVQLAQRDGSLSTIAMLPAESGDSAASIVTVSWDSQGTARLSSGDAPST